MSCFSSLPYLFLLLQILVHIEAQKFDYSDIEALKMSCSPHDTCSVSREASEDNLLRQNCECNKQCPRFKTCCVDSPFLNRKVPNMAAETCAQVFGSNVNAFLVSRCSRSWRGSPIIRAFCEGNRFTFRDPLSLVPVTNPTTQVSYKNFFCALCHDDDRNVVAWSVDVQLSSAPPQTYDKNRLMDDLVYRVDNNTWGLSRKDDRGEWEFVRVNLRFAIPDDLRSVVRFCRPNLVSSCDPAWRDVSTRRKCEGYMAVIYASSVEGDRLHSTVGFRNIHCALCNFVANVTDYSCWDPTKSFGAPERQPISFSLLLDVNRSDGDLVGRENICGREQVYDPFFKKCRSMRCAMPGFVIKDGKCVQG